MQNRRLILPREFCSLCVYAIRITVKREGERIKDVGDAFEKASNDFIPRDFSNRWRIIDSAFLKTSEISCAGLNNPTIPLILKESTHLTLLLVNLTPFNVSKYIVDIFSLPHF